MQPVPPQGVQRGKTHTMWESLAAVAACTGLLTGVLVFIGLLGQSVYFSYVITVAGGGRPQTAPLERLVMIGMSLLPHVVVIAAATTLGWLAGVHVLRRLLDRIGYSGGLRSRANLRVAIAAFLWLTSIIVLVAGDLASGVVSVTRVYMLALGGLLTVWAEHTLDTGNGEADESVSVPRAGPAQHLKAWVSASKWVAFGSLLLAAVAVRIASVYLDEPVYQASIVTTSRLQPASQEASVADTGVGIDGPGTVRGFLLDWTEEYVQVKSGDSVEACVIPREQVLLVRLSDPVPVRLALQGWFEERAKLLQETQDLRERNRMLLEESRRAAKETEAEMIDRQKASEEVEARVREIDQALRRLQEKFALDRDGK